MGGKNEARREKRKAYLIGTGENDGRQERPGYFTFDSLIILSLGFAMVLLSPTLFFLFSLPVLVLSATNSSNTDTDTCNPAHNGLATGTLQFTSDCNVTTWCNNGECQKKACRRDQYPLGYDTGTSHGNGKNIPPPPLCPAHEFCPDEGSQCVPQIAVGEPCQFDRDGS
jgi:hypothetical protein